MKTFPVILAVVAIGASGFAVPPQFVPDRTEVLPIAEPIAISIDELGIAKNDRKEFKESQIPKSISRLNGKRVRIIGTMFPTWEETGVKEFTFNGDTKRKWYSWNADPDIVPVEYYISVKLRDGSTTSYSQSPIEIEGELVIEPVFDRSMLIILYRIKDATVRPGKRQEGFKQSMGIGC